MTDADFMRLAIQAAWQGLGKGEMPFGACIVRKEQVLSVSHNSAKANIDTTAHAEVQAIREASRQLKMLELAGCVIYSTCEPCPMCLPRVCGPRSGGSSMPVASRMRKRPASDKFPFHRVG